MILNFLLPLCVMFCLGISISQVLASSSLCFRNESQHLNETLIFSCKGYIKNTPFLIYGSNSPCLPAQLLCVRLKVKAARGKFFETKFHQITSGQSQQEYSRTQLVHRTLRVISTFVSVPLSPDHVSNLSSADRIHLLLDMCS